jgi:ATP-dependent DNA helicase RecQ
MDDKNFNLEFRELKKVLGFWNEYEMAGFPCVDGIFDRIYQILSDFKNQDYLTCKLDLQCLLKYVLAYQTCKEGIATFSVPNTEGWPQEEEWKSVGVNIISEKDKYYIIESVKWKPLWVEGQVDDLFMELYQHSPYTIENKLEADFCFQETTHHPTYTSKGQRESVRGLFFMKPGSTMVVNLPTGLGKSIVGYIPSLISPNQGHMTLFIVPTVALALDQQRQVKKYVNWKQPLAWHAGLQDEDKKLIKQNIRKGNQPILFLSPESLCGALRLAIYDATLKGYLKFFVVDEAHLVGQWGDEFRPEFQAISGIRRLLLRKCPVPQFKTILMSATITDETLQTLEVLFDVSAKSQMISEVVLRKEPQYWIQDVETDEEKHATIIDIIKKGPRPFLLYVTKPYDARRWLSRLKDVGFVRVECFHGQTESRDRDRVVNEWRDNKLDGIVATSAFGVGMDKSDIRMVIHACVPESLDRFYQEVGRGGRDGDPSLSIVVYTNTDYKDAHGMVSPKIISDNLGLKRWNTLILNSQVDSEDSELIYLDMSLVPRHVKSQGDANKAWNLRTVLLLVRSGLLKLDATPPPDFGEEDDEVLNERLEEYFNQLAIRIINPNHRSSEVWEELVIPERNKSYTRANNNFKLLNEIFNGHKEVGQALSELYRIGRENFQIPVAIRCSSCPVCRKNNHSPTNRNTTVVPLRKTIKHDVSLFEKIFPMLIKEEPIIVYSHSNLINEKKMQFIEVLEELIKLFNIQEISVVPDIELVNIKKFKYLYKKSRSSFLLNSVIDFKEDNSSELALPRISILLPWGDEQFPEMLLYKDLPLHIIFTSELAKDVSDSSRKLIDIQTNIISYDEFIMRLSYVDFK